MRSITDRVSLREYPVTQITRLKTGGKLVPAGTFLDGLTIKGTSEVVVAGTSGDYYRQLDAGDVVYYTVPATLRFPERRSAVITLVVHNPTSGDLSLQLRVKGLMLADEEKTFDKLEVFTIPAGAVVYKTLAVDDVQMGMLVGSVETVAADAPYHFLGFYFGD